MLFLDGLCPRCGSAIYGYSLNESSRCDECGWESKGMRGNEKKRSRLAECLGVEDGKPFKAVPANPDEPETIVDIFVLHGGDFCFYRDGKEAKSAKLLCGLINGKFKTVPVTVWSEDSIKTARAAELLGFECVHRHSNGSGMLTLSMVCEDTTPQYQSCFISGKTLFPEIQSSQTVKLSEIK